MPPMEILPKNLVRNYLDKLLVEIQLYKNGKLDISKKNFFKVMEDYIQIYPQLISEYKNKQKQLEIGGLK